MRSICSSWRAVAICESGNILENRWLLLSQGLHKECAITVFIAHSMSASSVASVIRNVSTLLSDLGAMLNDFVVCEVDVSRSVFPVELEEFVRTELEAILDHFIELEEFVGTV